MISAIEGSIFENHPGEIHIRTPMGMIIKVECPVSNYAQLKKQSDVLLYTVLKAKEDSIVLYGFLTQKEKAFFQKLISISGVGGKTGLSFISAFSVGELVEAINGGDVTKISSIPGIGKKTAQRIVLELTGKLEIEEEEISDAVKMKEDLISGLVNLGYPLKGVKDTVGKTLKDHPEKDTFEELFKLILKKISKV